VEWLARFAALRVVTCTRSDYEAVKNTSESGKRQQRSGQAAHTRKADMVINWARNDDDDDGVNLRLSVECLPSNTSTECAWQRIKSTLHDLHDNIILPSGRPANALARGSSDVVFIDTARQRLSILTRVAYGQLLIFSRFPKRNTTSLLFHGAYVIINGMCLLDLTAWPRYRETNKSST